MNFERPIRSWKEMLSIYFFRLAHKIADDYFSVESYIAAPRSRDDVWRRHPPSLLVENKWLERLYPSCVFRQYDSRYARAVSSARSTRANVFSKFITRVRNASSSSRAPPLQACRISEISFL